MRYGLLLGLLPLLAMAALVVVVARAGARAVRRRTVSAAPVPTSAAAAMTTAPPPSIGTAGDALDRWVAAGLLSERQRAAILAFEAGPAAAPAPPPLAARRGSAVAEALGYLGAVLAASGLALIVVGAWPDLATAGRLVVSGGAAAVLLLAGAVTPEGRVPALTRLRWVLWLAGTAAAAVAAGVLANDVLEVAKAAVVAAAAATVAGVGAALWRGQSRPLQQLSCLGGVVVAVGALVAQIASEGSVGLAVWGVGVAYLAVGLRVRNRIPVLFEGSGGLAVVVGGFLTATQWEGRGLLFLVASALGLLALAGLPGGAPERADQIVVGGLGWLALLQGGPAAIGTFAEQAGGPTGLVTWAIGGLLLLVVAPRARTPVLASVLGGAVLLVGAGVTAAQWEGFGPLFGLSTAAALLALGTRPGATHLSVLGSVGLLVNVPWAISHFFPGEGRVPLLVMVTGAVLVAIAVLLTRGHGRPSGHAAAGHPA